MRKKPDKFDKILNSAMEASDLLDRYVDLALDNIEELSYEDKMLLLTKVLFHNPKGISEHAAKTILIYLIQDLIQEDLRSLKRKKKR